MTTAKLYMVLLGCKPPQRHTEQHDIFFGIANSLNELVPAMKAFWPEAADRLHIDAWREVTQVEGYQVTVKAREIENEPVGESAQKLFFINLGGYQPARFEEQHYVLLTIKADRASAFAEAKQTFFFQHNHTKGANSHIDDKYGIDVDDLYQIDEILSPADKERYQLVLTPTTHEAEDPISLGYLKLSTLEKK